MLLSAHICHPSLANDNCSGIALLTHPGQAHLGRRARATATASCSLPAPSAPSPGSHATKSDVARIKHGLVVSCVGDGGGPTYKKSRRGNADIDRAMAHVLKHSRHRRPTILDFSPYGYDERQYCSPGFNLPVGLFQRSQFGTFPEYHTSADNLDFIAAGHLRSPTG